MGEHRYEDYRSLIQSKAALVYHSLIPQGNFDEEDMEQEGYFIFLNAVRTYDPTKGKGKFEHYLWMKLHYGFKDFFRKHDYLPREFSKRRGEPLYRHPFPLEKVLEFELEWGLPQSLRHHDDHTEFEELDIVNHFWDEFIAGLPYHHRIAFNTWRMTGSQKQAADWSGLTDGRISQLMKKLDEAAIAYGERLRKADG